MLMKGLINMSRLRLTGSDRLQYEDLWKIGSELIKYILIIVDVESART